jgi:hypothetical protein
MDQAFQMLFQMHEWIQWLLGLQILSNAILLFILAGMTKN